jgi:hypothetical protein
VVAEPRTQQPPGSKISDGLIDSRMDEAVFCRRNERRLLQPPRMNDEWIVNASVEFVRQQLSEFFRQAPGRMPGIVRLYYPGHGCFDS